MKRTTSARIVTALAVAGILAISGTSYAAGTATFSLSPSSATETEGTTFSVTIYENGSSVNVVTANFSYDTTKLQLIGTDTSTSAFADDAGSTSTSISRYVPAGATVSGSQEVAVLDFKSTATGTTTIIVGSGGSHIASSGTDEWNGVSTSGQYTITAPAAPGSTGGGSGSTSTSSPSTSTGSTSKTSPSGQTNSTGNSSVKSNTTGTDSTTNNASATPTTKTSGTKTSVQTKKLTVPMQHVAFRYASWITSGVGTLIIVAAGLYWFVVRKRKTSVTASQPAPKRAAASTRKTTTRSKTTKK